MGAAADGQVLARTCSKTVRTAPSCSSGGYLFELVIPPTCQRTASPGNPGRFKARLWFVAMWKLLRLLGYTVFTGAVGGAMTDAVQAPTRNGGAFVWAMVIGLVVALVGHVLTLREDRVVQYGKRVLEFELHRCLAYGEVVLAYLEDWAKSSHGRGDVRALRADVDDVLASNREFVGIYFGDFQAAEIDSGVRPTRPAPDWLPPEIAEKWLALSRQLVWMVDRLQLPLPTPKWPIELRRYESALDRSRKVRPWDQGPAASSPK